MIIEGIVRVVMWPFRAALELLPVISPPDVSGMVASTSGIWQYAGYVNNFVPASEAVTLLGILMTAFVAITAVRAVLWVLTKAHILGGSS